jgi:hypothetical protein
MIPLMIGAGIMAAGAIGGGLIAKGGADAAGAASAAAGVNAWQRALDTAGANKALASTYLLSGHAGTNALMKALGLGHLNPFNVDGGPRSTAYGETSLNTDTVDLDRRNALSDFKASPGYQWRLDQGTRALDRSAASKGMLLSGAQTQGLTDFNQNQASAEWDNYLSRLFAMSGQGAGVTNATNNANTNALSGGSSQNFQGDMGQASQYASAANALASGISRGAQGIGSALGGMGGMGGGLGNALSYKNL